MLTMRLKTGPARSSEWRCCFCLHVRTATILLGIWHLILHVLALSVLAVIFRNRSINREVIRQQNDESDPLLPTPLSNFNGDRPYYLPQNDHALYYPDLDVGALVTVCTLAITLLLVYGTIKGKATHLLPFFCMQLFDFAITTLTATGYLCYLRSVHRLVAENWHLPWRRELLQLSPQCLSLLVLIVFLGSMLMKAYCIGIVWRCYKFLTFRQQAMRSSIHYIMPGEERQPEPDYSSLLPDYEAACAQAMKQTPPPSYQAAMAAQETTVETAVIDMPATVAVPAVETPVPAPATTTTTTNTAAATVTENTAPATASADVTTVVVTPTVESVSVQRN